MNAMTQIKPPDLHAEIASVQLADSGPVPAAPENRYRRWFNGLSLDAKLKFLAGIPLAGLVFVASSAVTVLANSEVRPTGLAMGLIGGCCLLVTVVVLVALQQMLSDTVGPLRKLTADMVRLSAGDRDFSLAHLERKDEIGDLARAFQVFVKSGHKLDEMFGQRSRHREDHQRLLIQMAANFEREIGHVASGVASAASQLQDTASAMAAAAEQSSSQTGEVSAAINNAAAGVTAAAAASDEFAMSINEISRQASSSAQLARKAGDAAREADGTISSLNDTAGEIGQIVGLISSIAQRTNLLALNASIEAARGGEAGRGFAVVASEVKDLAAQTGKATERVAVQIKAIQQGTSASVSALQAIVGQINELEATSVSIAAAVDQQSVAGQDLARSIDLAARSTENVSATVAQVRQASIATGAAATQVLTSSNELEQQASVLREQVDTFLGGVRQKAA
jgi:methyl-accepting chemotaxis protein